MQTAPAQVSLNIRGTTETSTEGATLSTTYSTNSINGDATTPVTTTSNPTPLHVVGSSTVTTPSDGDRSHNIEGVASAHATTINLIAASYPGALSAITMSTNSRRCVASMLDPSNAL